VLVDDLTRKGMMEPYRKFTSRAEYRLLLRADNADARLTERGAEAGVVSDDRLAAWQVKRDAVARGQHALQSLTLPGAAWHEAGAPMPLHNTPPRTAAFTLAMPGVKLSEVEAWAAHARARSDVGDAASEESALVEPCARETVEVSIKYAEALTRQQKAIERVQRSAGRILPDDLDYARIPTLSNEEVQKLTEARPRTLQEASEISGVTPHGIGRLLLALREYDNERAASRDAARSAAASGGGARDAGDTRQARSE
jgi:tRNA uridine 5-carboxymethylaminomethyl modification enzyme